jgi:hypothetical protein
MARHVLPIHYISAITDAIARHCGEAMRKSSLYLTKDELTEAFIQPDHVSKIREVYNLLGERRMSTAQVTLNTDAYDTAPRLAVDVVFYDDPGVFLPSYSKTWFNVGTPAGAKIIEWAAERRRLGLVVGDAIDAVETLNTMCGNALALSVCFPAIGSIMARSSPHTVQEYIDKDPIVKRGRVIGNGKSIGSMPSLPREVIDRIRTASATVQALLLTEEAVISVPKGMLVGITAARYDQPQITSGYNMRDHVILQDTKTRTFV